MREANDEEQQICVGPFCECAGTEAECACRTVVDGKYVATMDNCTDCGAPLKIINLDSGEDVE